MANEILYSGLGDLRVSEILHNELRLQLADRFSLWGHPAVVYAGNCAGSGSTTIKVPLVGTNDMAAVAENVAVSNTALTDDSETVTVAGQHLQYQISDLADLTDSVGLNVQWLVSQMVGAAARRWMAMLCGIIDDHTETAGTTGQALTVDDYLDARYALIQAGVPGPYLAVLAPEQVTDLIDDLRGETGPLQLRTDSQDIFAVNGQGIVANYLGDDIVASSYVTAANGDRKGALFGYGAHMYADGTPRVINLGGSVIPAGQQVVVELERDASGRLTKVVGSYYVGLAMLEDARGVTIVSAAAA